MQITLTIEQQAQLSHIAARAGKDADDLAREVFLRGLRIEAALIGLERNEGEEAAARIIDIRRGNMLPDGVTLRDLIREGRA